MSGMLPRYAIVLSTLLLILLSPRASQGLSHVTGSLLLSDCKAALKFTEVSPKMTEAEILAGVTCQSYVQGVLDTSLFWKEVDRKVEAPTPHFCIPEAFTVEQGIRILIKHLERNPKDLSENGFLCLNVALRAAYPCTD